MEQMFMGPKYRRPFTPEAEIALRACARRVTATTAPHHAPEALEIVNAHLGIRKVGLFRREVEEMVVHRTTVVVGWRLWGLKTYHNVRHPAFIVEEEFAALYLLPSGDLHWVSTNRKRCNPPHGWEEGRVNSNHVAAPEDIAQLDLLWEKIPDGRSYFFSPAKPHSIQQAHCWGGKAHKKLVGLQPHDSCEFRSFCR